MDEQKLTEKYIELLKAQIINPDIEEAHNEADGVLMSLLRELGFDEVVDVYCDVWPKCI